MPDIRMISEYHMACMTRGSPVTSPILPGELEDRLLPLTDYTSPEDRSGVTHVRVQDHQARTLRVAVWFHQLDMALSEEPAASGSLVRTQHHLGHLLTYFLGPRTAWELQFEDVATQVLKENQRHIKKKCTDTSSSLRKCRSRRTKLRNKFDAVSQAIELITDALSSWEMEHRLNTLQTSLDVVERSIMKFENFIEDCRMQEEEAHLEEEISQESGAGGHQCWDGWWGRARWPWALWPLWGGWYWGPPSSGLHWRCCLPRGGCPPHAAGIPTQRSSCWISQSQEWDQYGLGRDGQVVPNLPQPT